MSKVLRLYNEGKNTLDGWDDSSKYEEKVIEQIKDPNGASIHKPITSLPTPFARFDMVKRAFEFVSKKDEKGEYINFNKEDIFNKMVSDALDVGQIFFNFNKFNDKFTIKVWNPIADTKILNKTNQQLADTLKLYWEQDAQNFNFNEIQNLYLLIAKSNISPNGNKVIGCTSPTTLFVSAQNSTNYKDDDLSFLAEHVRFGNDKVFDNELRQLNDRDIEYHKFWVWISKFIPAFTTRFKELTEYLQVCYKNSDAKRRGILDQISNNTPNLFSDITINNAGNFVEVFGFNLKQICSNATLIENNSDFVINSTYRGFKNLPLILPNETFRDKLIYTNEEWSSDIKVPATNGTQWEDRKLPADNFKYPYLSLSDFLEDYLILKEKGVNNQECYCANEKYLFPLKNLFFQFFSIEDLQSKLIEGKPMCQIDARDNNSACVTLRIPIKKGFIEFKKNYYTASSKSTNDGQIINLDFQLAMFPKIKFENENIANSKIIIYPDSTTSKIYPELTYFNFSNKEIDSNNITTFSRDEGKYKVNDISHNNIAYIQISKNNSIKGIIVPKYNILNNHSTFKFAIDLGTTNTHIEYSVDGSHIKPFDIEKNDKQISFLTKYVSGDTTIINNDFFIPDEIGTICPKFSFPRRTALSEWDKIDYAKSDATTYLHNNYSFAYQNQLTNKNNSIITDLKWSNETQNNARIDSYIKSLFYLLRNKVLLNGGNLSNTQIIWFYPISMTTHRRNQFSESWEKAYRQYFGDDITKITNMTESLAPYNYFISANAHINSIVTIDVGGGTTDVVVVENNTPKLTTSYRFATNAIFADAFIDQAYSNNGIIKYFFNEIKERTKNTKIFKIIDDFTNKQSIEQATLLFSLKNNEDAKDENIKQSECIDFSNMLSKNDDFKIIFLLFYVAHIYHIANLMKLKSLKMPRHISFSGNGSKVISILSNNDDTLIELTKIIFEKVYGNEYGSERLEIHGTHDKNPKAATCKGGLTATNNNFNTNDINFILSGKDSASLVNDITYNNIDDEYKKSICKEVQNLINFTLEINKKFSYDDMLGINKNSLELLQQNWSSDIITYIEKAINLKIRNDNTSLDDPIEETLFFYPIIGILNNISNQIDEKLTQEKNS